MPANEFLTCPTDCDTDLDLGALDVNQDCVKVAITRSQILYAILLPVDATKATDWTDATDWASVIDNTNTDGSNAKALLGIGELPAPEELVEPMPNRKQKVVSRTYTMTHVVKNLSDAQYAFGRQIQCGDAGGQLLWYTDENYIYGGQNGIILKDIKCVFPKTNGENDVNTAVFTFIWEADGDPLRAATPL